MLNLSRNIACQLCINSQTAMRNLSRSVTRRLSIDSEKGVTAIEYGLIASLVAIAIIIGITLVGTNLNSLFNYIGGKVAPPAS
jgi:pilus assembly protein Flp/PilA